MQPRLGLSRFCMIIEISAQAGAPSVAGSVHVRLVHHESNGRVRNLFSGRSAPGASARSVNGGFQALTARTGTIGKVRHGSIYPVRHPIEGKTAICAFRPAGVDGKRLLRIATVDVAVAR